MSLKDSMKQLQRREGMTQEELLRRLGCSRSSLIETRSQEAKACVALAFGNDVLKETSSTNSKELETISASTRRKAWNFETIPRPLSESRMITLCSRSLSSSTGPIHSRE